MFSDQSGEAGAGELNVRELLRETEIEVRDTYADHNVGDDTEEGVQESPPELPV